MFLDNSIYLGLAEEERVFLPLNMANRHGLIAGASGTGKTITMKVMAESPAPCCHWRIRTANCSLGNPIWISWIGCAAMKMAGGWHRKIR